MERRPTGEAGGASRRPPGGLAAAGRALPWLVAPVAGALWATAFGVHAQVIAPWISLAPLFLLFSGRGSRSAFGLGWLHGTAFWVVSIPWVAPTLTTYGGLAPWLAVVLLVALALYLGLYTALFAAVGAPLWRRLGLLALVALPALWVTLEWIRGWLFSGFPWNLAGYAWTEVAGALPLAAWIGVWGVSFLVVLANAAVARAVVARSWRPAGWLLVPLLLLPLAGRRAVALSGMEPAGLFEEGAMREAGPGEPVRVIQPAIYNQVVYDPQVTRDDVERLFALSRRACDRPGALLVWPESAAWPYELGRDPLFRQDVERLAARGCPVLLNSTTEAGDGRYFNSAYLVGPEGVVARYDKRHLVPFGEYVPLKGVFSFLDRLARSAGDYSAADRVTLLPWAGNRLGMAICFEVTFPGEVADLVRAGATALVTITNDAWYGDTSAPWQHFRAARWRAAETRRPLVRAAITGVSGVIGPDGSVRRLLGVGEEGILRARIVGRDDLSPFVRRPWAVPAGAAVLAVFAMVLAAGKTVSYRGR